MVVPNPLLQGRDLTGREHDNKLQIRYVEGGRDLKETPDPRDGDRVVPRKEDEKDFANGYLFGEILFKLGLQTDFKDFKDQDNPKAMLANFSRLVRLIYVESAFAAP